MFPKEEFLKLRWAPWLERPYGAFVISMGFGGVTKKYFDSVGLKGMGFSSNFYQFPIAYKSEKEVLKNTKLLEAYYKKHRIFDVSEALEKIHKENKKNIKNICRKKGNQKRRLIWAQEVIRSYFPFLWITIPMEEHYQQRINSEVRGKIDGDLDKFIGDASLPKKKNAYVLMQESLANGEAVESVKKRFGWMKSRDGFTDEYTVQELEEIKTHYAPQERMEVKIPKELKGLFDELKELTFLRTDRTDKFYEALVLLRPFFREVAGTIGVSFSQLADYDYESLIEGNPEKYPKQFTYCFYEGKASLMSEKMILDKEETNKEVKGTVAWEGVARGIAKIVKHPTEVNKVKKGNILVAQMTFPSFISAMHKASAFVTDEGGITCHAAIVAREMKKPCIVGTKNATKVFKDGDEIEVDANNGSVKKIKQANQK